MRKTFLYIALFLSLNFSGVFALVLTSNPDTLDFGKLTIGSPQKTLRSVVTNSTGKVLYFRNPVMLPTYPDSLFVLNSKPPIKIQMFSEAGVEISFKANIAPKGLYFSSLVLTDETRADSILIYLKAEITYPEPKNFEITIPNITAKTGSNVDIPIILTRYTADEKITGFNLIIDFNSTVLAVLNPEDRGNIEFGRQIITLYQQLNNKNLHEGDTLYVLKCVAMLGNAQKTAVNLDNFRWLGETSISNFRYTKDSGSVLLTDIFFDNGIPRLATYVTDQLVIKSPNDIIKSDLELEVSYINYVQLKIIDILGNQIVSFPTQTPFHKQFGSEKILVTRSGFSNPGIYIVVLSGQTQVISKLLIIE